MPPSTDLLHVYLFGIFRLEFKAQSIHLPTRKADSLLAYLILYPGVHTREILATLFWGGSNETAARGSLRKALTILRKHIDDKIILSDREHVQINPSFPLWVDVFEFQRQAKAVLAGSAPSITPIDLYQDDLLRDFYDDWIVPLREHYHALYLDVLLFAVERARTESEYRLAIDYSQKVLASDAANEIAHQHLMFCYITLGDRSKALHQYEICQQALRDGLGVEPTRETRALYQWIRHSSSESPSLTARITNLPIPISSFIGRNKELSKVKQLLSNARLVTLTGAGGSGKTRLAIHAATDLIDTFKDGVWWVELAPLTDALLVPSAIAKALGIDGRSDQPLTETLKKFLHTRKVLLVLDNCEHLIDACAQLTETLLISCTDLKILATSREALCLTGENVWPIPPLSLPRSKDITLLDLLMQYEGIRLFIERAVAINPDFTPTDENAISIAQVCQRLDGIPLAIELAAASIRTMPLEHISRGLDNRFQLMTASNRTANLRHQTLRAAVDWSYDLLSDAERQLFCRLSIFSGGWELDAAETVCSGDGIEKEDVPALLAHLVDKSLVKINADSQRYSILETMRQYGNEKLIQLGKQDWIIQQHLVYYLKMTIIGDEKIRGPEQLVWLKWFETEQDNLAGAMERSLASSDAIKHGCELICATCWYWGMVGNFVIMKYWLEIALLRSAELGRTPTRARVLFNAGSFSVWGLNWLEPQATLTLIEESLEIWSELFSNFILERAQCLLTLGYIQKIYFNNANGFEYLDESIDVFQKTGNAWWHAWALNLKGIIIRKFSDDVQLFQKLVEENAALWENAGDRCLSAHTIWDFGILAMERGNFLEAQGYFQNSLQRYREFGAKGYIVQLLLHLGNSARALNKYDQAEISYKEGLPLIESTGLNYLLARIYRGLGCVALAKDKPQQAQEYFLQSLKVCWEMEQEYQQVLCIANFAALAFQQGKLVSAARLFGAFFAQLESMDHGFIKHQLKTFPLDKMETDNYLALCKTQMSQDDFGQAWNEGRSLSMDGVINEIMQEGV